MLKMGLIGLGRMGKYHLNLYETIRDIELSALSDVNKEVLDKTLEHHNVAGSTDYREILDKVDAVTVAAPTKYHHQIVKDCLLADKHVLVEKPITTNIEEAQELFEIARQRGLTLHIGHVERFNGAVQELKKIVRNPFLIESRRVGPYDERVKNDSIILDLMIHDIDIILNIVGKDVIDVEAKGSKVYSNLPDFASVNLIFENNAVANIIVSRITQKKDRTLSISQEDTFVFLDYTNQDINIYRKGSSQHIFGERELRYKNEYITERLFVYKDNPLMLEIRHFVDCVKGNVVRMIPVEHELRSLKLALKVDEIISKKEGRCEVSV
ncbi:MULTISPECIES: Gfo/Idh/MocA family protein [Flexistipes]|uniref:Oxidoreductase domain protein n=1 Tax=Flexistipes sinusarabici (strain ATCC 49648 / DSM 4947 / MAS 10) TaxID=717231 RepID=F8E4L7_FLESM|nr:MULTISPECIES: Gfo/Idh/MocA family oxidoreductase [Flexistipes]AEI15575.1 oxidoreductase domain protein [Flexistipes sinusarabici DSM 4947]MEC9491790.1 Gfo/Idh/MocA family oxidoreductase [Flexistipes sp.]